MANWILFRTFPKDDYLCRLALESFKRVGIEGNFIFLAEEGSYKYLTETGGKFIFRNEYGGHSNFGGQLGVRDLINSFKTIDIKDEDVVYLSDSDIVLKEKLIPTSDLEGTGGFRIINHVSGQLQMMKGKFFNHLKSLTNEDITSIVFDEMIPMGLNIADDTFNSYIAHKYNYTVQFHEGKWVHDKLYKYSGNMNFENVIKDVCNL